MSNSSSIPIIVQGNSFSLAIPLRIYAISNGEMTLQDYTPDATDDVTVQLKGSRRNYTYTPTIDGNEANIDLSGNELADNYAVVVSIVKANGQRLRSFRTDQFLIVESSDDLTQDDIVQGLEENVIYLNAQAFIAGADGRGITSIVKTGTSGLVDTYTITYTDNTTSTFTVTNGAQGSAGVGVQSIEQTTTSTANGGTNIITCTLTNGTVTTFSIRNGNVAIDNAPTSGSSNAVSSGGVYTELSGKADNIGKTTVATSGAVSQALSAGVFYEFTGALTSLTLTFASTSLAAPIYAGKFTADSSGCSLTVPASVTLADGVPSIEGGESYEFNIFDNVLLMVKI